MPRTVVGRQFELFRRVIFADRLGSAPDARAYFPFSCKKKVAKENARPQRRPACAGVSALLSRNGRAAELGFCPSDSPRPSFPLRLALLDDAEGQLKTNRASTANGIGSVRCAFPPPSCSAEQRSAAGGRRRGLFEDRRSEFRSRPAVRVAQGSRQSRPRNAGVAFFLVTFSWRRKKKLHAVRAENSASKTQSTNSG